MQRSIMLCVVWLVATASVAAQPVPRCKAAITAFLALPNQRHAQALDGVDAQACWQVLAANNVSFDRLLGLVSHGERIPARYLAKHLAGADGGNLEDALIALGEFADRDPTAFLRLLKQGQITAHDAGDAAAMLSLALSDQPAAQLAALQARRQRVNAVETVDLAEPKALVLRAIDAAIAQVHANLR